jgi:hypothetical protein
MHMHTRAACMVDEGSQRLSSPVFESSVPPIHAALGCAMYRFARTDMPVDALLTPCVALTYSCETYVHS